MNKEKKAEACTKYKIEIDVHVEVRSE